MRNSFFDLSLDARSIRERILELDNAKVGFYSVGLYPASLAYNCAMQNEAGLLLAVRPGRELLGAFSQEATDSMDSGHVETMLDMGSHRVNGERIPNTLADLIQRCDLVVLSANSSYVEEDLLEACRLREDLGREQVVLACLAGSFNHDPISNSAYVLCEKQPNLAFFSGFHRHGALRNPFDSFTANFCHPNALTAMLGAQLLDRLSPNIQVSPGVHNVEGQYIKAAKNMASVFAGFGYGFHQDNPGVANAAHPVAGSMPRPGRHGVDGSKRSATATAASRSRSRNSVTPCHESKQPSCATGISRRCATTPSPS